MEWLNNLKLNLGQDHLISSLILAGVELAFLLVACLAISLLTLFSQKRIPRLA